MAPKIPKPIVPLSEQDREHVDTRHAAHYLDRSPQTLRQWACNQTGAVLPISVNGRLAWPVASIRKALGVQS